MDDRLAKAIYENNILERQQSDERRLALLEKLATTAFQFQPPPIPGATPDNPSEKIFLEDDFLSAVGLTGFVTAGTLSWIPFNVLFDLIDAFIVDINHPGIATLESSSGGTSLIAIVPLPVINSINDMQFVMRFDDLVMAGDLYRIGILSTPSPAQEGVYFQYSYGDTNWQTVTDDGAAQTINDSGIAFDNTKWFLFRIKRKTTDVFEFYINQTLVATHSTNITTSNFQYPIVYFEDVGYNTFNLHFDYFLMELAPIVQRWD